jgi:hypothetical protein
MKSWVFVTLIFLAGYAAACVAQSPVANDPPQYGPYSGVFLPDGMGLRTALANKQHSVLLADSPSSLYCWINTSEAVTTPELIAGLGSPNDEYSRYLGVNARQVTLWIGDGGQLTGTADLKSGTWHLLAATFDGSRFNLYSDGRPVSEGTLVLGSTTPLLQMAPTDVASGKHFGGRIADFIVLRRALSDAEVSELHKSPPDFSTIEFEEGSKPWPTQTRAQAGYRAPQDPSTRPKSRAPFSRPVALKRPPVGQSLTPTGADEWTFSDSWSLREAPKVNADGAQLATPAFSPKDWMRATVPGTVLTTMASTQILTTASITWLFPSRSISSPIDIGTSSRYRLPCNQTEAMRDTSNSLFKGSTTRLLSGSTELSLALSRGHFSAGLST